MKMSRPGSLLLLVLATPLALFAFPASTEIRYWIWGKSATATLTEASYSHTWRVRYSFEESDGLKREGTTGSDFEINRSGINTNTELGSTIDVQYIPKTQESRLARGPNVFPYIPCLGSLGLIAIVVRRAFHSIQHARAQIVA